MFHVHFRVVFVQALNVVNPSFLGKYIAEVIVLECMHLIIMIDILIVDVEHTDLLSLCLHFFVKNPIGLGFLVRKRLFAYPSNIDEDVAMNI